MREQQQQPEQEGAEKEEGTDRTVSLAASCVSSFDPGSPTSEAGALIEPRQPVSPENKRTINRSDSSRRRMARYKRQSERGFDMEFDYRRGY